MTSTNIDLIPVRTVEGVGRQILQVIRDGKADRQISYRGTLRQARAHALLQYMHDTDPGFEVALAALRGQE